MKKLNDSWPDKLKPICVPGDFFSRIPIFDAPATCSVPNVIQAAPTIFPTQQSFDEYNIRILTGKTGTCYFGLYLDNGWFYPGKLLSSSALESTGFPGLYPKAFSFKVHPGAIIWCAWLTSAAYTSPYLSVSAMGDYASPLITWPVISIYFRFKRWIKAFPFAPLPDPFPSGADRSSTSSPIIFFRCA